MDFTRRDEASIRARFLGSRLTLRHFETEKPLAVHPLTIRTGERGVAVLFRFGAAALVDVTPAEETAFYASLAPHVSEAEAGSEVEELRVEIGADGAERLDENGHLRLRVIDLERLRVVAHVLAKSAVLTSYERRATAMFDRIEILAEELRHGRPARRGRQLAREIGDLLLAQARTVGRAEVTEKPELTWDDPVLDRLYEHLAVEFELRERDRALARKLEVASNTVETYMNLLMSRQGIRVEWYIVALIVVEIALTLYEMARHGT